MIGIQQIKADGTVIDLHREELTVSRLQELVESGSGHDMFEFVSMRKNLDGSKIHSRYSVGGQIMAVNESGLVYNLPANEAAMDVLGYWRTAALTPIVGDVVIIENEASDFDDMPMNGVG